MNKFKYFLSLAIAMVMSFQFVGCSDKDELGGDEGFSVKVFAPTNVYPGQPVVITGSGLADAVSVEFPDGVTVGNIKFLSPHDIEVITPEGINAKGGELKVINSNGEVAVAQIPLTVGKPEARSFNPVEQITQGEVLQILGSDLMFVKYAIFDGDEEDIYVESSQFVRKAKTQLQIRVPKKAAIGFHTVRLILTDGSIITVPAEIEILKGAEEGHYEYTKKFIWENQSDAIPSWDGVYRFSNIEHKTGEEIYAFPMEDWAIIKDGEVYFMYKPTGNANVRVTDGWWKADYGGAGYNCAEEAYEDEETGNMVIKLNIKADGNLYNLIDEQHLLFTGSDYLPVGLFILEESWVGPGGGVQKVSYWKNGEQSTVPVPSWSGEARFSSESNKTGEVTYAFPDDVWEILKNEPFRVEFEKVSENPNIRVTTGWWTGAYGGTDYNCYELVQEDEDGKFYIEIDLKKDGNLYDNVDAQHLLFTGDGYRLVEIYQMVEGAAGNDPIIIWENDGSVGAPSWSGEYRFSNVNTASGEQIFAMSLEDWEAIKEGTFYLEYEGDGSSNVRITTGWWTGAYGGTDYNCNPDAADGENGLKYLEINIKADGNLYENIDAQHLLFTGEKYVPKRIYYFK